MSGASTGATRGLTRAPGCRQHTTLHHHTHHHTRTHTRSHTMHNDVHTLTHNSMNVEGLNTMTNPRRTNSTRRNKLRARVLREEAFCWLCGEAVNTSLQAGLPQSPEVDEILPVSLGGDPYDRANMRLAHRLCNQKRGNKLPNEAIEAAKARIVLQKPLRKSREW